MFPRPQRPAQSPAPAAEAVPVAPRSPEPLGPLPGPRAGRELLGALGGSPKAARKLSTMERGHGGPKQLAFSHVTVPAPARKRPPSERYWREILSLLRDEMGDGGGGGGAKK